MSDNVIIYGAGGRFRELIEMTSAYPLNILAVIDADAGKIGTFIEGYEIKGKEALCNYSNADWCITVSDRIVYEEIKNELICQYHMNADKLISYEAFYLRNLENSERVTEALERRDKEIITDEGYKRAIYFDLLDGMGLGGIEERIKLLVCGLHDRGKRNTYIITNTKEYKYDEKSRLDKNVLRVDTESDSRKATIEKIAEKMVQYVPCTIVTNQPNDLLLSAYVIKKLRPELVRIISIISGSHEYIFDRYLNLGIRSDLYIGVSEDIKREFIAKGATNVISMKVPFPCDKELKREYSLNELKPIKIGYAGRLDGFENSQKRMDLVLNAILKLKHDGINFIFEIAGEGPVEQKMQEIVITEGLRENVVFLGRLPKYEMQSFWKKQDIGINLADFEGRSISVAEMMGGGAVPVVTDVSGVREDIVDGGNGFIIPVGDYSEAAKKIEYLYWHRDVLRQMGQRAHDDIWPVSRMDKHLDFWMELLELV